MNHLLWLVKQDKSSMSLIQPILSVILEGQNMHENHDEDSLDILETMFFSSRTIQVDVSEITYDIHIGSDHNEGIWEIAIP